MTNLRNFTDSIKQSIVEKNYALNHKEMTMELVKHKNSKWLSLSFGEFTIKQIIDMLNELIDDSDPDVHIGNSVHAFQTAEKIRADFPDEDWMHLTGLIHDLGKILCLWGEPQHLVVGDTYVMGCKFSDKIVFHKYFQDNPDAKSLFYQSKYGIYKPEQQSLDNLIMSWGHDDICIMY